MMSQKMNLLGTQSRLLYKVGELRLYSRCSLNHTFLCLRSATDISHIRPSRKRLTIVSQIRKIEMRKMTARHRIMKSHFSLKTISRGIIKIIRCRRIIIKPLNRFNSIFVLIIGIRPGMAYKEGQQSQTKEDCKGHRHSYHDAIR